MAYTQQVAMCLSDKVPCVHLSIQGHTEAYTQQVAMCLSDKVTLCLSIQGQY